jgi:hypothetical protein
MDEIFGSENFVADLIWLNKEGGGGSDSKLFRIKHEHILCYSSDLTNLTLNGVEISNLERYTMSDEYEAIRGKFYLQKLGMGSIQYSQSLDYPIQAPDGLDIYPSTKDQKACWRWSKQKLDWGFKNGFIVIKKDNSDTWQVYTKQYLKCDNEGKFIERTNRPMGVIETFSSTQAGKHLKTIFDNTDIFKYSKPYELLHWILKLLKPNALILDAFAGSGTTGHATLKLNAEDGGNRKFILIQQPEPIKPETTAHQAGFTTVDAITRERLRRVIDGVPSAKDAQLQQGLGGSFTAVTLGEPINLETLALATDETLPSRENLGRFVFYNTTLQALETLPTENATGYLGETATHKVYLLYKPERQALTGTMCAFTLERAERIAQELAGTGKEAIVYAPISFVDAKTLKAKKWAIRYCNLPYELLQLNPVKPAPEGLV